MKILSGYLPKDGGEILIDGRPATLATPAQAVEEGIGMLYQDPMDFPALTVLDNFILGQPARSHRLNRAIHEARFCQLADEFGFRLHPLIPVEQLTIGERQPVEMLRF